MANAAGIHYFRCPLCNNNRKFRTAMKECGILIPDRDAAWESNNSYVELLERYSQCDATNCVHPEGPNISYFEGPFQLIRCEYCGHSCIHAACGKLKGTNPSWHCTRCVPQPKTPSPLRKQKKVESPRSTHRRSLRSRLSKGTP